MSCRRIFELARSDWYLPPKVAHSPPTTCPASRHQGPGNRTMPDGDDDCCASCDNTFQPIPRGVENCDLTFSHIPKVLKGCLHTICQSCAEERLQHSKHGSSIKCPLCGMVTSDVTTTNDLQDNILALQDLHRKNRNCDLCDEDVKACHFCNECESLLCTFHANDHAVSRGTKGHKVLSLKGREREGSAPRISHRIPIMCGRHKDVPAKLFCSEPCGTMMCYDCSVAKHSGHTVVLADSEDAEVRHRADLTRRGVGMGHRLAQLQGSLDAIEAVKTGVEQNARMAETAAIRFFSSIRAAVNSREKAVLKNVRIDRASKMQDLDTQLEKLEKTVNAYAVALEMVDKCVENLHGNQLLAMVPALRECLNKHDAKFPSLALNPCAEDRVEFEHDRRIAVALRQGISKLGYLAQTETDFRHVSDRKQRKKPKARQKSAQSDHIHFTLAAVVGGRQEVTSATPTDVVVVEIRKGPEHEFLENGIAGPVIGKVALTMKLKDAKHLTYESEHFFESLSQHAAPERQQQRRRQQQLQPSPHSSDDEDGIPTVRFTKTLRVIGRRERGQSLGFHSSVV